LGQTVAKEAARVELGQDEDGAQLLFDSQWVHFMPF